MDNINRNLTPPKWATKLLVRYCPAETLEEIQGDLQELYIYWIETVGERAAQRRYVLSAIRLLRPFETKPKPNHSYLKANSIDIIRSYFIFAFRNLIRQKVFSLINIIGLALGMSCSLFIWLWVQDELQKDAFHTNAPHLYRVMSRQVFDNEKAVALPYTPGLLAEELKRSFPQIIRASGFTHWEEQMTFTVEDKINKEKGSFVSPDWLHMFSFPLIIGDASTALGAPSNIAISHKLANKYFGSSQSAIGKTIRGGKGKDYQVTAVFEDISNSSSFKFDFLLPWEEFLNLNPWASGWDNNSPSTFIQIKPHVNPTQLEAQLRDFLIPFQKEGENYLFLQPFEQMYLYSNFTNGQQDGGRIEYVWLFKIIGVFILIIACINFMNLATARSMKRAREVGIRKVAGAVRSQLIGQFMGEAFLLTLIAVLVALATVIMLLPAFNELTGKEVMLRLGDADFLMAVLGLVLTTGFLAGIYPAMYLSSFKPIVVLKGLLKFKPEVKLFRQSLVVIQFSLSTLLIIGTLIVYQQLNFIYNKNIGYHRGNLLYVPLEGELVKKYETFKQELLQAPGIESVSWMTNSPTSIENGTRKVEWPGKNPLSKTLFTTVAVGYDFAKALQISVLQGRDFSPAFGTDTTSYLINRKAAQEMGLKNPIGTPLSVFGRLGRIVGLVEDFHFESLHVPIDPLVIQLRENKSSGNIMVRIQPEKTKESLTHIEALVKQLNPALPFTYYFADEEYTKQYQSEQVISKLANYFAFLGIFVSCIGLLALAAFTAEQRRREIGVRKILGASVASIIILLSKDILKLVLIAFVLALPLAWYIMVEWLNNFAYQIELEWWIFALAGVMVLSIALLTVSWQAIKTALANPMMSLRSE